jgi:hypothetical protein
LFIEEFKALFQVTETTEDIRKKMSAILPVVQAAINDGIKQGFRISDFMDNENPMQPVNI